MFFAMISIHRQYEYILVIHPSEPKGHVVFYIYGSTNTLANLGQHLALIIDYSRSIDVRANTQMTHI